MTGALTPADRLRWLLRTLREAITDYEPEPPTDRPEGPGSILPSRYYQGSYRELEHWLRIMRTCHCPPARPGARTRHTPACMARTYWHLRERYIDADTRQHHGNIRLIKIKNGHRIQGLPPHAELADPFHVAIRQPIAILVWHHAVSQPEADRGIDWLLLRMHGGDTSRITLPRDLRGAQPDPVLPSLPLSTVVAA